MCTSDVETITSNTTDSESTIIDPDVESKESDDDTALNSSVFVSHELNNKPIINKAKK